MDVPVALDSESAQHAVEVAHRVWWVGDVLVGDPFQCHPYLVEAGEHSLLIDPGSTLTIEATLRKVQEVVPLEHIQWVLLHHSDPDIADSLHTLSERLVRDDVQVITEWRAALLLKHFAARFPFVTVEDLGWQLEVEPGRTLEFLLTPYLHFPGAFVTFDASTRSLFSSDLFGGFNRARRLWAVSEGDFEDLRQFHEHYMPSREILMAGLATITARFPHIDRVLPQHGYCIPGELVASMFEQLGQLECGVMLASRSDTHLARLLAIASGVRRIEAILEAPVPLGEALAEVSGELRALLPLREFWVEVGAPPAIVRFDVEHAEGLDVVEPTRPGDRCVVLDLPDGHDEPHVAVVICTTESWEMAPEVAALLAMVATRVHHVADEALAHREQRARELVLRAAAQSDPLTGLLNRRAFTAMVASGERPAHSAVLMIDIDHFKKVNDTYGHAVGDAVLRAVASAVTTSVRRTDTAIRYGGEEVVAIVELNPVVPALTAAATIAERVRSAVASVDPGPLGLEQMVTVSVGAAVIDDVATLKEIVRRADVALYRAKEDGRDRVVVYDDEVMSTDVAR
jgi:diguanylate cyclase (GGDEF)-like protein